MNPEQSPNQTQNRSFKENVDEMDQRAKDRAEVELLISRPPLDFYVPELEERRAECTSADDYAKATDYMEWFLTIGLAMFGICFFSLGVLVGMALMS